MKNIIESTASFEAWLRSQIELYEPDLQVKHRKMAEDPFEFMRATFYRWAEVWPERCKALANTHHVVGVGDLHIENFGTWRDREDAVKLSLDQEEKASSRDLYARLALGVNSLYFSQPICNRQLDFRLPNIFGNFSDSFAFDRHRRVGSGGTCWCLHGPARFDCSS